MVVFLAFWLSVLVGSFGGYCIVSSHIGTCKKLVIGWLLLALGIGIYPAYIIFFY